jgi:hypothetical protein
MKVPQTQDSGPGYGVQVQNAGHQLFLDNVHGAVAAVLAAGTPSRGHPAQYSCAALYIILLSDPRHKTYRVREHGSTAHG